MSKSLLLVALGVCAGSAYSLPALRPKGLRTRHTLHAPTTHALVAAATPAAGDDAPPAAELRGGASGEPGGTLVLLGAVVMLFVSVHRSLFSVGIVPIQKELGLGASTVGVLQSAYLAGYALTNAPGGAIADRLGGAPVMLACLAGQEKGDSTSLQRECFARARFEIQHPRFESAPRDDRSSKNQPKRAENGRERSL